MTSLLRRTIAILLAVATACVLVLASLALSTAPARAQSGPRMSVSVPAEVIAGVPFEVRFLITNFDNNEGERFGFTTDPMVADSANYVDSTCIEGGARNWDKNVLTVAADAIGPDAFCRYTVEVRIDTVGDYEFSVKEFVTRAGSSTPPPATFSVIEVEPPSTSVSFSPEAVLVDETTTMTLSFENTHDSDALFSFRTTQIPNASLSNITSTCGGGGHGQNSGVFFSSNRTVRANDSCEFTVDIVFSRPTLTEVSFDEFSSTLGAPDTHGSATVSASPQVPMTLTVDAPDEVPAGQWVPITIHIDHTEDLRDATAVSFQTTSVPNSDVRYVDSDCGEGENTIIDSARYRTQRRTILGGTSCEINLEFAFGTLGEYDLSLALVNSSLEEEVVVPDSFTVVPGAVPVLSLEFDEAEVGVGEPVGLTATVDNTSGLFTVEQVDLNFVSLDGGDWVFVEKSCFGPSSPAAIDGGVKLHGLIVLGEGACEVRLTWTFDEPGDKTVELQDSTTAVGVPNEPAATITVVDDPLLLCDGWEVTIDMNTNGGVGVGTEGRDVIMGTPGNDVIEALGGDDLVCAGGGNDRVLAGRGNDIVYGGEGDDKLFGSQGADALLGEGGADVIHGNRGNDRLIGGDGPDKIYGYAHDDFIMGGDGDDRLHGNFGEDVIRGGAGNDRIFGYGDNDELHGGAGDDLIGGNRGDDQIYGDDGNDTLYGSDGSDQVDGGAGNDSVEGNSGDDVVRGGVGNDTLDGGINNDACHGDAGTDTATRCETRTGIE